MQKIVSRFILYSDFGKDAIITRVADICKDAKRLKEFETSANEEDSIDVTKEDLLTRTYREVKRILELGTSYAFDKNLWQNYLTYEIITNENPFSLTCEKVGASDGSVNFYAKQDFEAFMELFHYDFTWLEEYLDTDVFSRLTTYKSIEKPELMYNKNVSEKVRALSEKLANAKSYDEFFDLVTGFYKDYGVGMFGLNKAFRLKCYAEDKVEFKPINNMDKVVLSDLVGYEIQKKKLVDNTKAFVEGKKANNVLLFGDSGTGKSTSIKAIVNEFYDDGLRMIEIYKHQFKYLSTVISKIKNRNYKFIIYMDDLSFEEFEIEYKFLKAVIEGGVESRPANILIYATSNRRHLIKENWSDRDDVVSNNGMHKSDTMEEKLSLAYRFGVRISYSKPTPKEFYNIVFELAKKNNINMDEEEIRKEANKWELSHGGISGRCATQFIDYLLGTIDE
ncbi:MAG TPA: AAA family ATPase [Eubacterium sp.]|nr:AAA family ATPase [Eubacterium sp.]